MSASIGMPASCATFWTIPVPVRAFGTPLWIQRGIVSLGVFTTLKVRVYESARPVAILGHLPAGR